MTVGGASTSSNTLSVTGWSLTTTGIVTVNGTNKAGQSNKLIISGTGSLAVGGALSSSGNISVAGGSLTAATYTPNSSLVGAKATLTISGGTTNITTFNQTASGVGLASTTNITGGTVALGTLTVDAASTFSASGGAVTVSNKVDNSGKVNFTGKSTFSATTFNQLAGTATFSHAAATTSSIGTLSLSGGTLSIGANDTIKVSTDYANSNFGSGNSFNAKAGVTGGGQIVANGNSNIGLTVGGNTVTAPGPQTLAMGNVHTSTNQTSVTKTYQITNTGSDANSPAIRGAIQNFGTTDATKLSCTGVTAANFNGGNALAAGASTSDLSVTFASSKAGELTGQYVQVVDNFGHTNKLNISGAAYDLAKNSTLSPATVNIGNVHAGTTANQSLPLTNTQTDNPTYTENLKATVKSTDAGVTGAGTTSSIASGATGNVTVGLDTSTAGAKSGNVAFNMISDGAGNSGLGETSIGSQSVTVTGAVYDYAAASNISTPVTIYAHVGEGAGNVSQNVSLKNTAADTGGYTETLSATVGGITAPNPVTVNAGGTMSNIAAQGTGNVTVGASTAAAGAINSEVTFNLISNSIASGLTNTNLAPQTVDVLGGIYAYADPEIQQAGGAGTLTGGGLTYTLDFGTLVQGSGTAVSLLDIFNNNNGVDPAWVDLLNGTFDTSGVSSPFSTDFAAFLGLAGGSTTGSYHISLSTSTLGDFTQSIIFHPVSANTNLGNTILSDITLILKGKVMEIPEMDALAATGALTFVVGILALAGERRRRS